MHIYIYIYIYMIIRVFIIYINICTQKHRYKYMYYICVCVSNSFWACWSASPDAYTHTRIHIYTYIYLHTYICVHAFCIDNSHTSFAFSNTWPYACLILTHTHAHTWPYAGTSSSYWQTWRSCAHQSLCGSRWACMYVYVYECKCVCVCVCMYVYTCIGLHVGRDELKCMYICM